MTGTRKGWFANTPTPFKLLLIITAALLPFGLAGAWISAKNLKTSLAAAQLVSHERAANVAYAIQTIIARNLNSTRIAANAVLPGAQSAPCAEVQRILTVAPSFGRKFLLADSSGRTICSVGLANIPPSILPIEPDKLRILLAPSGDGLFLTVGTIGGSASVYLTNAELVAVIPEDDETPLHQLDIWIQNRPLRLVSNDASAPSITFETPIVAKRIMVSAAVARPTVARSDMLVIFLPIIMWAAAGVAGWLAVTQFIIRPLRHLQAAVASYQPEEGVEIDLPEQLGPAREVHELRDSFQRTIERIEAAELETRSALDGQRRLVREVHHRVKNNLQVVASLLSIHGRMAEGPDAKAAYGAIGRRVDALSVVHRNHYAELEDNRGIALRPMLTELSAGLRASSPEGSKPISVDLDIENAFTTQDVAVAIAFLITEIVEFAMLNKTGTSVRISLRRTSELTASLSLESDALVMDDKNQDPSRIQFDRIVEGLARQLRSPLEMRLGRYAVTLPVFPERAS